MRVFVDTNVLSTCSIRGRRPKELLRAIERPFVSPQVLGEFFVTVTRKFERPMSTVDAVAAIDRMRQWQVVPVDSETVAMACRYVKETSMSYWDAQVAASAAGAGCGLLLTEDLSGAEVVLGVRRENPFG